MIDTNDIGVIEHRLKQASQKLHQLAPQLGVAKQVKSYDGDRRKNLLAKYTVKFLKDGESATAAETHARADETYKLELGKLAGDLQDAETTIAMYDAEYCSWESARSLLSFAKQTMNTLNG